MPLPNTSFNITGKITRPALSKDGITCFVFYNNNISDLTTFSSSNRIVKFTNLPAIEATGINSRSTNFIYEHYQISEYFRLGGKEVYIGIFAIPVTHDFTEINDCHLFSKGEIKMYGVFTPEIAFSATNIGLINTICQGLITDKKPAIALYTADTAEIVLSALPDLRDLASDAEYVSVVIGQDTQNTPATILTDADISVANVGAVLGALSSASVEENVLNVGKFNYTDGSNMLEPGLVLQVGVTPSVMTEIKNYDTADLDDLNDKGYIFFRFFANYAGTFLSNDHNCTDVTTTFNSIHIVRVKNKVVRELDKSITPLVGSKVLANADGTLRPITIKSFYDATTTTLNQMIERGEISAFDVFIDPAQKSIITKTVTIEVSIVPVESADNIVINVSFVASL